MWQQRNIKTSTAAGTLLASPRKYDFSKLSPHLVIKFWTEEQKKTIIIGTMTLSEILFSVWFY